MIANWAILSYPGLVNARTQSNLSGRKDLRLVWVKGKKTAKTAVLQQQAALGKGYTKSDSEAWNDFASLTFKWGAAGGLIMQVPITQRPPFLALP